MCMLYTVDYKVPYSLRWYKQLHKNVDYPNINRAAFYTSSVWHPSWHHKFYGIEAQL